MDADIYRPGDRLGADRAAELSEYGPFWDLRVTPCTCSAAGHCGAHISYPVIRGCVAQKFNNRVDISPFLSVAPI